MFDAYCIFAIGQISESDSIVHLLCLCIMPKVHGLVEGARVSPQACDLMLFANPLVDVGTCMASPNITQPRGLQRDVYNCVPLANDEHEQVADMVKLRFRWVAVIVRTYDLHLHI